MNRTGIQVDADLVAVFDDRDRSAFARFGRNMSDEAAVVGAGESAVRHYRCSFMQSQTVQVLEGAVHLHHTRTAFGAFIPDDYHRTGFYLAVQDGFVGCFFRIEDPRLAAKLPG